MYMTKETPDNRAEVLLDKKIELMLRTSCRFEDMLDEHQHLFAYPGFLFHV